MMGDLKHVKTVVQTPPVHVFLFTNLYAPQLSRGWAVKSESDADIFSLALILNLSLKKTRPC